MSLSRIEELLEMINNKSGPTDMIPLSRTEEILKCYINGTAYTGPITSRFEELLYNTLYKQPSDEQPLSRSEEILKSKIDKTTYEGAILSRVEELLLELKTEPDPVEITIGPDTILHVLNAIEAAAISLKIDLTPTQDGTPWISDTLNTEPYLSRAAQNGNTADETIVGGTVAWNQLVNNVYAASAVNGITRTQVGSVSTKLGLSYTGTCTQTAGYTTVIWANRHVSNHVYYITLGTDLPSGCRIGYSKIDRQNYALLKNDNAPDHLKVLISNGVTTDFTVYPQISDLTLMFGSTIADYVYSLETATAGAGVTWLRSHGFIDDVYHAYNEGTLISAKPTAKVVGDTTYTLGGADLRGLFKLDANNNLYCDGDVYTSDGTITRKYGIVDLGTLSWGYSSNVTRFGSSSLASVIARPSTNHVIGNIKCARYVTDITDHSTDSNYDKIIMVAASGNIFIRDSAYTDAAAFKTTLSGVYLVYELATATTEASTAYTNPQKAGEAEAFVDSRTKKVPVGHSTRYSAEYAINGFEGVTVHVSPTQTGGTTYPVTFTEHGTVYGGTIDVVSGELKITWGYIASYNGESLPGVWMSSKEVYAEGTSPSLGAEVSYILSTPITATIDPMAITISEGENYVWAEEGNSTLTYMGIPVTRKRLKIK